MQVILIQSEIEEAIQDYVRSRISLLEGQRVDVDLKATRGADGYQAMIDIVPENQERRPTEAMTAAATEPVAPTPRPRAKKVELKTEDLPFVPDEPAVVATQVPEAAVAAEEAGDEPAQLAKAQEEASEAPVRPSLFGNLKKPVNS